MPTSKECFMSASIVDSESYITHLLLLLLDFDEESIEALLCNSRRTKVPVYGDDLASDYEVLLQNSIAVSSALGKTSATSTSRMITRATGSKNNENEKRKGTKKNLNPKSAEEYEEELEILFIATRSRSPLRELSHSNLNMMKQKIHVFK